MQAVTLKVSQWLDEHPAAQQPHWLQSSWTIYLCCQDGHLHVGSCWGVRRHHSLEGEAEPWGNCSTGHRRSPGRSGAGAPSQSYWMTRMLGLSPLRHPERGVHLLAMWCPGRDLAARQQQPIPTAAGRMNALGGVWGSWAVHYSHQYTLIILQPRFKT